MPALSRWMWKIALGYLLLGFGLGLMLLMGKVRWLSPGVWRWHPIHIECLQVGWLFHLALGTAYWLFPRIERSLRPRSYLAWSGFVLLNFGVIVYSGGAYGSWQTWIQLGRLLEFLSLVLFAAHLWPRIKPFEA